VAQSEVRKSPRFRVTLSVLITGVDEQKVLRSGDISSSGLFLEIDREVGRIGSMQRVELCAEDGSCPVVLLARVVRIASVEDFWKGRTVAGVALQFMFVEEPGADLRRSTARPASESQNLQLLLKQLVQRNAARHGIELQNWRGTARTHQGDQAAQVQELSPRGMAIETNYAVEIGEVIRVEMPGAADKKRPSFSGKVAACDPLRPKPGLPQRFRVMVRFGEPPKPSPSKVAGASMDDAFEALLSAVTSLAPPPGSAGRHLAGELSRISLISVVTLCQIERVTGSLLLKNGTSVIRAFLQEGEVVDALVEGREVEARAAVREVVGWSDGTFEVVFEPVTRPHRIGVPTSALIFDLARELDELAHRA